MHCSLVLNLVGGRNLILNEFYYGQLLRGRNLRLCSLCELQQMRINPLAPQHVATFISRPAGSCQQGGDSMCEFEQLLLLDKLGTYYIYIKLPSLPLY